MIPKGPHKSTKKHTEHKKMKTQKSNEVTSEKGENWISSGWSQDSFLVFSLKRYCLRGADWGGDVTFRKKLLQWKKYN